MNRELNAILTVIAIGYEVKITINNIDIGVKGLKSESLKLFGKDNPTIPTLPEDMKKTNLPTRWAKHYYSSLQTC